MKGFLKVFIIILVVAIIAIVLVGGVCGYIGYSAWNDIKEQTQNQDPASIAQRSKSILDYTLPADYQLIQSINVMGVQAAIFQYTPDAQPMIIASAPWWMLNMSESNFKQKLSPEEIEKALKQSGNSEDVEIQDVKIVKEGELQTATRKIPYVQAKVTLFVRSSNKTIETEGIFSVVTFAKNKKNVILVSGNKVGQFNMTAAEEFVKNIKVE